MRKLNNDAQSYWDIITEEKYFNSLGSLNSLYDLSLVSTERFKSCILHHELALRKHFNSFLSWYCTGPLRIKTIKNIKAIVAIVYDYAKKQLSDEEKKNYISIFTFQLETLIDAFLDNPRPDDEKIDTENSAFNEFKIKVISQTHNKDTQKNLSNLLNDIVNNQKKYNELLYDIKKFSSSISTTYDNNQSFLKALKNYIEQLKKFIKEKNLIKKLEDFIDQEDFEKNLEIDSVFLPISSILPKENKKLDFVKKILNAQYKCLSDFIKLNIKYEPTQTMAGLALYDIPNKPSHLTKEADQEISEENFFDEIYIEQQLSPFLKAFIEEYYQNEEISINELSSNLKEDLKKFRNTIKNNITKKSAEGIKLFESRKSLENSKTKCTSRKKNHAF